MASDAPQGFINGVVPYHWTQVVNVKRDPLRHRLENRPRRPSVKLGLSPDRLLRTSMTGTCCL